MQRRRISTKDAKAMGLHYLDMGWLSDAPREDEWGCIICRTVIFKKPFNQKILDDWITVKEQKHLESEEHKQAVILRKLSGEDDSEV